MQEIADRSETVRSFARGLLVIRALSSVGPHTSASVAGATALPRATARRFLLSLVEMGYVRRRGGAYELDRQIRALGESYLTSIPAIWPAREAIERLTQLVGETSALAVPDAGGAVFVHTVRAQRPLAAHVPVGERVRLRDGAVCRALQQPARPGSNATLTVCDDDPEPGVRTAAMRVSGGQQLHVAAIAIMAPATRLGSSELTRRVLPSMTSTRARLAGGT